MSVGSIGTLGTDDDQAQSAWDLGAVLYSLTAAQVGNVLSPVLTVSPWHSVAISFGVVLNPVQLSCKWYLDAAGTQQMGEWDVRVDPGMGRALFAQHPNHGPFVQFGFGPATSGTAWTPTLYVVPSNRVHPTVVAATDELLYELAPTLAAGAASTVFANCHYGGPIGVRTNGGSQGVSVQILTCDPQLNYTNVETFTIATNIEDYRTLILPSSASKVTITNSSGASANNSSRVVVCASQTGG